MSVLFTASNSPSSAHTRPKRAGAGVEAATIVATLRSAACSARSACSRVGLWSLLIVVRRETEPSEALRPLRPSTVARGPNEQQRRQGRLRSCWYGSTLCARHGRRWAGGDRGCGVGAGGVGSGRRSAVDDEGQGFDAGRAGRGQTLPRRGQGGTPDPGRCAAAGATPWELADRGQTPPASSLGDPSLPGFRARRPEAVSGPDPAQRQDRGSIPRPAGAGRRPAGGATAQPAPGSARITPARPRR